MSEPLWISAGATAVGTATITEADDTLTLVGHGLGDGDTVVFDNPTGGAVGVLEPGVTYFVVNATADTFQVAAVLGGPPVEFAADGGVDVSSFGPCYPAQVLRRAQSMFLAKASTADRFGAREGVHPSLDPAVSVAGTQWTLEHFVGVVYPGTTSTSGPYVVQIPSELGSFDPADGTNDRIDALDIQVQDDLEDSSGFRRARVVYVSGTPGSPPPAPPLTPNSYRVATFLVSAGGAPGPMVAGLGQMTVATGGVLPVRDSTELPASGLYDGLHVFVQDGDGSISGGLHHRAGSAWVPSGAPGNVEVFTDDGTYNPPAGLKAVMVEVWGAGGGGGGAASTGGGENSVGSGGGGGGYARKLIPASDLGSSVSVTVGGGGSGGAAGANGGSSGSTTSFGSHLSASGGGGGTAVGAAATFAIPNSGLPGGGSNGDLNVTGSAGTQAIRGIGPGPYGQGAGGAAAMGGGSRRPTGVSGGGNGPAGESPGGGGAGAHNNQNQGTARSGGDGANGRVIVTEYF